MLGIVPRRWGKSISLAILLGAALVLSACVGSGGGGEATPNRPLTVIDPDKLPKLSYGQVAYMSYVVVDTGGSLASASSVQAPEAGDIIVGPDVLHADGVTAPSFISVRAGDASVLFDAASGAELSYNAFGLRAAKSDAVGEFVVPGTSDRVPAPTGSVPTAPVPNLTHQSYGAWTTGVGLGIGIAAVGSFGSVTAADTLPTGGEFGYSGTVLGFYDNGSGVHGVNAGIDLNVNFGAATFTVSTNLTNVGAMSTVGAWYDPVADSDLGYSLNFSGSGTLSGTGLTATVGTDGGGSTPMAGTLNGSFYGPGAAEVGGTFEMNGTGGTYIGAFGATQQP